MDYLAINKATQPSFARPDPRKFRALSLGLPAKRTWQQTLWYFWGSDVFVNGVPLLKTFTLINVLLTIGLVSLLKG